jgi:hypothetical protein
MSNCRTLSLLWRDWLHCDSLYYKKNLFLWQQFKDIKVQTQIIEISVLSLFAKSDLIIFSEISLLQSHLVKILFLQLIVQNSHQLQHHNQFHCSSSHFTCSWLLSLLLSLKLIVLKKRNLFCRTDQDLFFYFLFWFQFLHWVFVDVSCFNYDLVLDLSWLQKYNSDINWRKNLHITISHSVLDSSFCSECYN